MYRKRRTRAHIIHDLGLNHTERYALLCGFSVERVVSDYGTDLVLSTYSDRGEIENGAIYVQAKATESLTWNADRSAVVCRLEKTHLLHWLVEPMPVILIVYDARSDRAYWLYVQRYFGPPGTALFEGPERTLSAHLPVTNCVDQLAMRRFAGFRNRILDQVQGVIRHD